MRILHVAQPTEAGVANVVAGMSSYQTARGNDVVVASPDGGDLRTKVLAAGTSHTTWQASREPGRGLWGEVSRLAEIVREVRPDVVHLHSTKAGLAGRIARTRAVTVFQPHAWGDWAAPRSYRAAVTAWERIAQRRTDLTLCLSDEEVAHAAELRARDVRRVRNGVDTAHFSPRDRVRARGELGLPTSDLLVVCVGRLARQKGQDTLLGLWPRVVAQVPHARLALVGDGPERSLVDEAAARLGVVVEPGCADPRSWYAAADVVVMPSRWEGAALVPLEASAMGRAVIGYDVGGLHEVVVEPRLAVRPGHEEGLLEVLTQVLLHDDLRHALESSARDVATSSFSAEREYARVLELYLEAAARAGGVS